MPEFVSNSLAVPCEADTLVQVHSRAQLLDTLDHVARTGEPLTVLGECSNTVLLDRIEGLVVRPAMRDLEWYEDDSVIAGAGVSWDELVRASLERGLRGLENLSAIPGSVGAAPFQNIGAYGRELADVLRSVHVVARDTGNEYRLAPDECAFGYRDSRFKSIDRDRFVIVAVEIELNRRPIDVSYRDVARSIDGSSPTAAEVSRVVREIRARKLPDIVDHPNAGSFFKNPVLRQDAYDALNEQIDVVGFEVGRDAVRVPAARLIDAAGWKERGNRHVGVWHDQPLVIVNRGGARGVDVLDFARRIRDDVFERFGVRLEQEPVTVGVS